MHYLNLISRSGLFVVAAFALASPAARAQVYGSPNMGFDQQFWQTLNSLQQQNAASMNQIWQYHLQTNGPRLRAQYLQLKAQGYPGTYEQFAYWDLMTAAGTNLEGAREAQRQQIEGLRRANDTQQSAYGSYIDGLRENSQRTTDAVENFSNQAIRGVSPYINTQTGATQMLPYYSQPGQVLNYGGNYYFQDQSGTYFHWTGNSWVQMQPRR